MPLGYLPVNNVKYPLKFVMLNLFRTGKTITKMLNFRCISYTHYISSPFRPFTYRNSLFRANLIPFILLLWRRIPTQDFNSWRFRNNYKFKNVYGTEFDGVYCWFHLITKNMDSKRSLVKNKDEWAALKSNVAELQLARSRICLKGTFRT